MSGLRHLAEYIAMRSVVAVFALPPRPAARAMGRLLGTAVHGARVRRETVMDNLRTAFPGKSDGELSEIAAACFRHFGEIIVDLSRLTTWSREMIVSRTRFDEIDRLQSLVARGKGVVIATAHFGAVDIGPARMALEGFNVTSVYQRVHNPFVDAYIRKIRSSGAQSVATRGQGLRAAYRAIRNRDVVVILADQDGGSRGIFIPFFGREASSLVGPAEIALRTGATLVTGFVVKIGDHYHHILGEEIPHSSVELMMRDYYRQLEAIIRTRPEQYFWLHRRYKTVRH